MKVTVVETPELGDRSYVVHAGSSAVVIDPQRDLDRIEVVLSQQDLHCTLVLETHIHNDYVSGGLELSRRTGATYGVSGEERVQFARHPIGDGDELTAGSLRIRVVSTPGHTDTHLAFVVDDLDDVETPPLVFTGGSLLFGSVGRTDLVGAARTEELARAQFRSVRALASSLADEARVLPTHGFGSFCSAGPATAAGSSTIGQERIANHALTETDEDAFVTAIVRGLNDYPAYYARMGPLNREGPGPVDLSPLARLDASELGRRITAGEWVVDVRDRRVYADRHLRGTVGIELNDQFATYLGWLVPSDAELTLLAETQAQVTGAQRQLVRIGIDRPSAAAVGSLSDLAGPVPLASYRSATFAELEAGSPDGPTRVLLDVRQSNEYDDGHRPGAVHVPLHHLPERLDQLPAGQLWVHCASGFRASIAAALLERAGRDVVWIDDQYS